MRISDWSSDVCASDLIGISTADLVQQVRPADHLVERVEAELGEGFTDLLGDEGEQVHHLLGRARELVAQARVLGAHPDRTGVRVALDRKSVVSGKRVSVRVDLGGRRRIKKTKTQNKKHQ